MQRLLTSSVNKKDAGKRELGERVIQIAHGLCARWWIKVEWHACIVERVASVVSV